MRGGLKLEKEFPEAIIKRIQSLLPEEEAARTSILSKSWYSAWITRPNLELDESRFDESGCKRPGAEFSKYAKKTIKRYEQSNQKIESLKLCLGYITCYADNDLANKLIVKALTKLGAIHLSLQLDNSFALPCEVVFGSDNLLGLSVKGCRIKLAAGIVLNRCRLESLGLDGVRISSDALSKIISNCPLIEKLSLSNIYDRRDDDDKDSDDEEHKDRDDEEHHGCGGYGVERGPATGPIIDNLHRLRCLVLCYDSFKTLFPGELLSKFPLLTDLTLKLKSWYVPREVQISNCSLEHIKIEVERNQNYRSGYDDPGVGRLKVKLDVPSIRKFIFEGIEIPLLTIISTSTREWESHVSIGRYGGLTAFWWNQLNEFFIGLSRSKIHLSLLVEYTDSFDYNVGDINIVHKQELENLTIHMTNLPSLSCHALFDGLFRLCHPKLITQHKDEYSRKYDQRYYDPRYGSRRTTNIDCLCRALKQGMMVKVSVPSQFMYGLNDLEEVNAQVFDVPEWRPVPLESLFDAPHDEEQRVRLLLKWKPT